MIQGVFGNLIKNIKNPLKDLGDNFGKEAVKEFGKIIDGKLEPLADRLDLITKDRIDQAGTVCERTIDKTKKDIEYLINHADGKAKDMLLEIDRIRRAAIEDLEGIVDKTDSYIENYIDRFSLIVMNALQYTADIANDFKPEEFYRKLFEPTLADVAALEDKLFQDVDRLIDKIDEVITGNTELIRREFQKHLLHALPNPLDRCRQKLNIAWKPGAIISDIELYELNKCHELCKIDESSSINEILKTYGQLQQNASMMAALVRKAPELRRQAVEDWVEYGLLCDFWRSTVIVYENNNSSALASSEKTEKLFRKI